MDNLFKRERRSLTLLKIVHVPLFNNYFMPSLKFTETPFTLATQIVKIQRVLNYRFFSYVKKPKICKIQMLKNARPRAKFGIW